MVMASLVFLVYHNSSNIVFGSADRVDLWVCNRRYSYWIQDACTWLAVYLLHAKEASL